MRTAYWDNYELSGQRPHNVRNFSPESLFWSQTLDFQGWRPLVTQTPKEWFVKRVLSQSINARHQCWGSILWHSNRVYALGKSLDLRRSRKKIVFSRATPLGFEAWPKCEDLQISQWSFNEIG
jgi:hypothetical protein